MPRYVQLGEVPAKRHTQFRQPDGSLYFEEVFGTKGFSGIASILYHANLPTQIAEYKFIGSLKPEIAAEEPLRHHHVKAQNIPASGDPISGRIPLLMNSDVSIGICRPECPMEYFYKNADGDDLLFIHEGSGHLETMFGTLAFSAGDYLVIPRGVIYRQIFAPGEARVLVIESSSAVEIPRRFRNEYGQLLEHAPYYERDIRVPHQLITHRLKGRFEVRLKARWNLTAYIYDYHPLDVAGWDGYLYPWAFNINYFEPITGLIHQPPPTHQTFEGHNYVVCSFVPRMLDYHPDAVPIPYNHSNLESDEMLYYVNGSFASRRGIEEGSITLHPSGLPHGPQPGAVEASIGKKRTEELAVMVDTFHPLLLTRAALDLDDGKYPHSWSM